MRETEILRGLHKAKAKNRMAVQKYDSGTALAMPVPFETRSALSAQHGLEMARKKLDAQPLPGPAPITSAPAPNPVAAPVQAAPAQSQMDTIQSNRQGLRDAAGYSKGTGCVTKKPQHYDSGTALAMPVPFATRNALSAQHGLDMARKQLDAQPLPGPAPITSAPAPDPVAAPVQAAPAPTQMDTIQGNRQSLRDAANYERGTSSVDGPSGVDQVPAMLSAGEAVLPVKTVQKLGAHNIARMIADTNDGKIPKGGLHPGGQYDEGMVNTLRRPEPIRENTAILAAAPPIYENTANRGLSTAHPAAPVQAEERPAMYGTLNPVTPPAAAAPVKPGLMARASNAVSGAVDSAKDKWANRGGAAATGPSIEDKRNAAAEKSYRPQTVVDAKTGAQSTIEMRTNPGETFDAREAAARMNRVAEGPGVAEPLKVPLQEAPPPEAAKSSKVVDFMKSAASRTPGAGAPGAAMNAAGTVLKGAAKLATPLTVLNEGNQAIGTLMDTSRPLGERTADAVLSTTGRLAPAAAGAGLGAAAGAMTGPAAPVMAPILGLAGGAVGYWGGDKAVNGVKDYLGIKQSKTLAQNMGWEPGSDAAAEPAAAPVAAPAAKAVRPVDASAAETTSKPVAGAQNQVINTNPVGPSGYQDAMRSNTVDPKTGRRTIRMEGGQMGSVGQARPAWMAEGGGWNGGAQGGALNRVLREKHEANLAHTKAQTDDLNATAAARMPTARAALATAALAGGKHAKDVGESNIKSTGDAIDRLYGGTNSSDAATKDKAIADKTGFTQRFYRTLDSLGMPQETVTGSDVSDFYKLEQTRSQYENDATWLDSVKSFFGNKRKTSSELTDFSATGEEAGMINDSVVMPVGSMRKKQLNNDMGLERDISQSIKRYRTGEQARAARNQ